jgi:hypothetical protein
VLPSDLYLHEVLLGADRLYSGTAAFETRHSTGTRSRLCSGSEGGIGDQLASHRRYSPSQWPEECADLFRQHLRLLECREMSALGRASPALDIAISRLGD